MIVEEEFSLLRAIRDGQRELLLAMDSSALLKSLHDSGMDLMGRYKETGLFSKLPVADQVGLINAAARMFDAFQTGCGTTPKASPRKKCRPPRTW